MINYFLDILSKYGIGAVRDGYESVPTEHCFAVWSIEHRKAMGADGYGLYWLVTYEVRIYYRGGKTDEDCHLEKTIENEICELNNLESDYDYDSKDKIDITVYSFTADEDF